MTRNPHLTELAREQLIDVLTTRIRDAVRVRLGRNTLGTTRPGEPIELSAGEADAAARAALAAVDEHAFLEVRHYAPTQDAYDAACKALEEQRKRADAAEQAAAELEAEGVERMADRFMEQTKIRAMEIRGGMDLDLEPARELVALWVGAARGMLGDAPNYTETPIEAPTDNDPKVSMEVKLAGEIDRYAFVLQRVGKVTPHQARMQAEERADRAEEEAAQLREEISRLRAQGGEDA